MQLVSVTITGRGECDWSSLQPHKVAAHAVTSEFARTLRRAGVALPFDSVASAAPLLWKEAHSLASVIGVPPEDVVLANLFYDLASSQCACTAFATRSSHGPLHAHCLDWEQGAHVLRKHTMLFRFTVETERRPFYSIGWPGFLGVFVGIAPGRCAVTVNAVWSKEERRMTEPLGIVVRQALSIRPTFEDVQDILGNRELACDCLLLITGARHEDMVVVERTPHRSASYSGTDGLCLLTNHYIALQTGASVPGYVAAGDEPFGQGTRDRYDQAMTRLRRERPTTMSQCLSMLKSPPFTHDMTLQGVVLNVAMKRLAVAPMDTNAGERCPPDAWMELEP
ncbi:MAG: hypothetical protein JXA58_08655 [Dehalococcoidia bacterium]|nr:hypothetical protein [Dehalococcoidia bacterium]